MHIVRQYLTLAHDNRHMQGRRARFLLDGEGKKKSNLKFLDPLGTDFFSFGGYFFQVRN